MNTWSDKKWFLWSLLIYPVTIWGWCIPGNVAYDLKIQEIILLPGIIAWFLSCFALAQGIKRIVNRQVSLLYVAALILFFIYFIFPIFIIVIFFLYVKV
ncbi:hypothetical protein ACVNS2_08190 [Paenibacillus caseinilyticus]|nr:hypothetical protein [Paenibacillus mucilaginosus]